MVIVSSTSPIASHTLHGMGAYSSLFPARFKDYPGAEKPLRPLQCSGNPADRAVFSLLLPLLVHAGNGKKCFEAAILFRGADHTFFLLPGHKERFFEFRNRRKLFRVDRGAFVAAMENAGLDVRYMFPRLEWGDDLAPGDDVDALTNPHSKYHSED